MFNTSDPVRQGNTWLFSDGTRLPVVSGGSGNGDPVTGGVVPQTQGDPDQFDEGRSETEPAQAPQPQPATLVVDAPQVPEGYVSQEELNRRIEDARKQEKDKLYRRLDDQGSRLKQIEEEREAERQRLAEEERQRQEAEEARLREEMSAKELLEQERSERLAMKAEFEEQLAARDAALEQERAFLALQQYIAQKRAEVADDVVPELIDLVAGNSVEEVDAAASTMVARSASILQNVMGAASQQHLGMQGAGITNPPVGPVDNQSGHKTFTAEDIKAMSMEEFSQVRDQLLPAAGQQVRSNGLYG